MARYDVLPLCLPVCALRCQLTAHGQSATPVELCAWLLEGWTGAVAELMSGADRLFFKFCTNWSMVKAIYGPHSLGGENVLRGVTLVLLFSTVVAMKRIR